MDDLMPNDEDLLYEEELLRNPYNLKMWWRYISARSDAPARRRYLLFERALRALPGSYKVGEDAGSRPNHAVRASAIIMDGILYMRSFVAHVAI